MCWRCVFFTGSLLILSWVGCNLLARVSLADRNVSGNVDCIVYFVAMSLGICEEPQVRSLQ